MAIGHDNYIMQVRYADTPSQKELKRITSERRQYRTNEYNIGAYGTHAVGVSPSIYAPALWNRRSQGTSSGFRRKAITDGDAVSTADGSGDEGATVVERSVTAEDSSTPKPVAVEEDSA
ncbi:hypothetical protein SEPCBS119000_003283 [Sporothrix epigloea]|uniref:Uncharacterized protein n=1 Tax=Sporothrix epigloea TaxID=1892477 RepID=A0ABP0DKT8_9PEZI